MAYKAPRVEKSTHLTLHLITGLMEMIRVIVAFKFHRGSVIPNLYSLHSWLGMATICIFGLQWVIGFLIFRYHGASILTRTIFRPRHAYSGLTIFFMAICTAETGLVSKAQFLSITHGNNALLVKIMGLTILLFGIFVSIA